MEALNRGPSSNSLVVLRLVDSRGLVCRELQSSCSTEIRITPSLASSRSSVLQHMNLFTLMEHCTGPYGELRAHVCECIHFLPPHQDLLDIRGGRALGQIDTKSRMGYFLQTAGLSFHIGEPIPTLARAVIRHPSQLIWNTYILSPTRFE